VSHPYAKYDGTESWKRIELAIRELQNNKDIELATPIQYVVGYLCKSISETGDDGIE